MAQFDVYANPSRSAAKGIPYVVVVQSDLLDGLATRLTIPLATVVFAGRVPEKLCPTLVIDGVRLNDGTVYMMARAFRSGDPVGISDGETKLMLMSNKSEKI